MSEQLVRNFLTNAVVENRLAHAYLLWGPKTSTRDTIALEIAKSLACPKGSELNTKPCGECSICKQISHDSYAGFLTTPPEKTSIEIDDVRDISNKLAISFERIRIVFIPEIEKMTQSAANAFLKILEEPGGQTVYLLTTGNPAGLLPTIISRCHRLPFFLEGTGKGKFDSPELNSIITDSEALSKIDPNNLLKYLPQKNKKKEQVHELFHYILNRIERALSSLYEDDSERQTGDIFSDLSLERLLDFSEHILLLSSDILLNINLDLLLEELIIHLIRVQR